MENLTLVLIVCVVLEEYLVKVSGLPGFFRFVPELLSGVILIYVFVAGTRDRFRLVAPKYWIAFGAFAFVIACGLLINATGAGPALGGLRFYVRAIPLFFLPAVLPISSDQLKRQLKWLLVLAFIQVPIAAYQRWMVQNQGRFSGDDVKGTVMDSGILTLFLVYAVVILTGMVLRRRIGFLPYAALVLLLLLPTAINETKVTLFILPLGVMAALYVGAEAGKRLRYATLAVAGSVLFVALFIPVYNMTQVYNPFKNEKDITTLFTSEKLFTRYMTSDVRGVGTKKDVRRGDALVVPFRYIAKDPIRLMFGLGMGAVSPSNLGKNFEGSYFRLFEKFLITSLTFFLLEFGMAGLLLIGILFWFVFRDSLTVARRDKTFIGDFAVGWTAIVVLTAISTIYTIFHEFTSVTYLYWYFSGVVCAQAMRLRYEALEATARAGRSALSNLQAGKIILKGP
jgi:hypothetical protein